MKKAVFIMLALCFVAIALTGCIFFDILQPAEPTNPTEYSGEKSGRCGENLVWKLDDAGVLTISGVGPMWDLDDIHGCNMPKSAIKTVIIGDGVTTIGDWVFEACRELSSVSIGSDVESIGEFAFSRCYNLKTITIEGSVRTIGKGAFYHCEGLTNVTIGDSVTTIGQCAFEFCSALTEITLGDGVTIIGESAFHSCESLTDISIPASVIGIGENAFQECKQLVGIWVSEENKTYSSDDRGVLFNKEKTELNKLMVAYDKNYKLLGCTVVKKKSENFIFGHNEITAKMSLDAESAGALADGGYVGLYIWDGLNPVMVPVELY